MNLSTLQSNRIKRPENITYMILFIDFKQTDVGAFFLQPKPIEINGERQINETDCFFILNYTKSSEQNEILYIFYDVEEPTHLDIKCKV